MKCKTFPKLFEPAQIGRLEVRNRLIMAAMLVGYAETDGRFSRRHVDYFAARARGGVGLIVTGSVLAETRIQPIPPGAPVPVCDSDSVIPRLKALVGAVHKHGAKIALQIAPGGGRQSHLVTAEAPPAAPSPVPSFLHPEILCRELGREQIRELVEACASGAMRAAVAGFDMIDVHAHTGYLIDQFMTPLWNRRGDEYGGDLTGRMRFPLEILRAIRERVGESFPISFRLTAEHGVEGGRTLEEAREIAQRLEAAGVDLLFVDAGCYDADYWMNPPVYFGDACLAELAATIKEGVGIPVVTGGNITTPELAEEVLAAGKADFIALGRSLLADPEWVSKAGQGRVEAIRPCIMCNEYCLGRMPSECMVNARLGKERARSLTPAGRRKQVMVVGGGPGGMEAARVAARRGHDVTLYERGDELGGQLNPAGDAAFKKSLLELRDNLAFQIKEAGVRVELHTEVIPELVETVKPDVVVVATGATPRRPSLPGIDNDRIISVIDLHSGKGEIGESILVAGGGLSGCDAAFDLALKGKTVTIVEMTSEIGRDLNRISRNGLLKKLADERVTILTEMEIKEFAPAAVVAVDAQGKSHTLEADTVVLALGARSADALVRELDGKVGEIRTVGDCVQPRKIGEAIHEGFLAGLEI
ncbi:MAG: FAD-dependent oxidoreductase [bacterium]|nr:FAD-dependent oxidoreductase [bacterium]